jgi:hypothetical protein
LVVENIPPEFCNLDKVNEFFKKFGTITNIQVERQFWRATVQYATPYEAKAAHSSPDPVFGNRFVKIFYMSLEAANTASGAAIGMDTDSGKPAEPPKPALTPEEQAERDAKLKEIRQAEEKVKKEQLHAKILLAKLQAKEQLAAKAAEGGVKPAMSQKESEKTRLDRDLEMIASGEPGDLKNLLQSKVAELQAEVRSKMPLLDCTTILSSFFVPVRPRPWAFLFPPELERELAAVPTRLDHHEEHREGPSGDVDVGRLPTLWHPCGSICGRDGCWFPTFLPMNG